MARKRKPTDTNSEFVFRIIAGELKGRTITAPDLGITRPPLTRLRKSLFDFLNPYLFECRYLDLFSGTGSYLFEAASRGAADVVGVELELQLCDAVNRQAEQLGVSHRVQCLCEDVFDAVVRLADDGAQFDIISLAPPQYKGIINDTLNTLAAHPIYKPDSLIICQHDTSETKNVDTSGWDMKQRRKYGNTTFTILAPLDEEA